MLEKLFTILVFISYYFLFCSASLLEEAKRASISDDTQWLQEHFFNRRPATINPFVREWSLLHWACSSGSIKVVRLLLELGTSPEIESHDANKDKPILVAARFGHAKVIEELLKTRWRDHKGLLKSERTKCRWLSTCLSPSAKKGADINAMNAKMDTALHLAAYHGHIDAVKILLENQANVRATQYFGNTPTHYAVMTVHPKVLQLLVKAGADLSQMNTAGETPISLLSRMLFEDKQRFIPRRAIKTMFYTMGYDYKYSLNERKLIVSQIPVGQIPNTDSPYSTSKKYDDGNLKLLVKHIQSLSPVYENTDYVAPEYEPAMPIIHQKVDPSAPRQAPQFHPLCRYSLDNKKPFTYSSDNEDRLFTHYFLFNSDEVVHVHGVIDGHGGDEVSSYLIRNIANAIEKKFQSRREDITISNSRITNFLNDDAVKTIEKLLFEAVMDLDRKICKVEQLTGGAVMSFVVRYRNTGFIVNVGDSRTLVIETRQGDSQTPEIIRKTFDHTASKRSEKTHIHNAGGFVGYQDRLNGVLIVSRAFGDCNMKMIGHANMGKPAGSCEFYDGLNGVLRVVPDIQVLPMKNDREYLFFSATDGLFDEVQNETVLERYVELRGQKEKQAELCKTLAIIASRKGSIDDISVVMVVV